MKKVPYLVVGSVGVDIDVVDVGVGSDVVGVGVDIDVVGAGDGTVGADRTLEVHRNGAGSLEEDCNLAQSGGTEEGQVRGAAEADQN